MLARMPCTPLGLPASNNGQTPDNASRPAER